MTRGKRSRCSPSPPTGARTSSARTSPAVRQALVVWRRHVPGERRRTVIRTSSTSPTRRTPRSSPRSCSKCTTPPIASMFLNEPPEVGGGALDYSTERCVRTVRTIRRCSLAAREVQAPEFSTFAISSTLKRSRTGRGRLRGRLSFPDQVAGRRASIEPSKSKLVWRTFTRFLPPTGTGASCSFGSSVMATVFRSSALRTVSKRATRTLWRNRSGVSKSSGR